MTAIVGGQQIPSGIQMTGNVNVVISQNQSWTVPSGQWFEGVLFGSNGSVKADINGSSYVDLPYQNSNVAIGQGKVTLGPGTTVFCRNSSSLYIRGVTFSNGN